MNHRFDDFELDSERGVLARGGEALALNSKALEILALLIERRGEVVSKNEILDVVWKGQIVEENNLTVQMSALRKALGESKDERKYVATVPGQGYKFVGAIDEPLPAAVIVEKRTIERMTVDEFVDSDGKPRPWIGYAIAAGIVAVAIAAGIYFLSNARTPAGEVRSLAVLPFAFSETDSEYLSEGLAESVAFSLSRVPGLKVVSQGSAKRFKDSDAQKAGTDLGVDAVLTGRITRRGEALEIASELVATSDNRILWGERFTRPVADLEKIQADIASSIAGKLRLRIASAEPRGTSNPEAYRLYLQGMYALGKRTPEHIRQSIEFFDRAIALDPAYSLAYGGRAVAWRVLPLNGVFSRDESRALLEKAREATRIALQVDQNLPEAHAVQSVFLREARDFAGAEAEIRRAIELNPNFATAHQWYSELLALLGRHDEAAVEIAEALELDPFSRPVMMNAGLRHLEAGRFDEALAQFDKLIALEPDYAMSYLFKSEVLIEKGRLVEASKFECRSLELLGQKTETQCAEQLKGLESAFATRGENGFWKKDLEYNIELHKSGVNNDIALAASYLRAGDREKALELLEKAFSDQDPELYFIKVDVPFTKLKGDPRYDDLVRRLGL